MRSATLILSLEVQGSETSASSRGAVGAHGLTRGLNRSEIGRRRVVRGGDRGEGITAGHSLGSHRPPEHMIQLDHVLVVHDGTADMPDPDTVVHAETRGGSRRHDVTAVRTPFTDTGVSAFDGADLAIVLGEIVHVDLTCQVAKTSYKDKPTVGGEGDGVAGPKRERVLRDRSVVEDGGLGRHESVHDTELPRVGGPGDIVDGSLLVQRDAGIKCAAGTEKVQRRLAVVALARAVHIRLGQHEDAGTLLVPLELDLVALEERLLRDGAVENGNVEDLDGGGLSLFKFC